MALEDLKKLEITSNQLAEEFVEMFQNSLTRSDQLFKEIYDKSRTIHVATRSCESVTPKVFRIGFDIHLTDPGTQESPHYFLKVQDKESFESEYATVYHATNIGKKIYRRMPGPRIERELQIFPILKSKGFFPFRKRNWLLFHPLKGATIYAEMFRNPLVQEKLDESKKYSLHNLHTALDPILLLHEIYNAHLAKQFAYTEKLPSLTKEKEREKEPVFISPLITINEYIEKILGHFEKTKIITDKEAFERPLRELVKTYLTNPALEAIVHNRCTPEHNNTFSLLSARTTARGSRALDIGALFGYPFIYRKIIDLEDTIHSLIENYMWKRGELRSDVDPALTRYINKNEISQELLENATYFSAAYINWGYAAEFVDEAEKTQNLQEKKKLEEKAKEHINVSLSQLEILAQRDYAASALTKTLKK